MAEVFSDRSEIHCQACGARGTVAAAPKKLESYRSNVPWGQCRACGAFVIDVAAMPILSDKTKVSEFEYLESRPWAKESSLSTFKELQYAQIVRLAEHYAPPPKCLLDIGCNYGGLLEAAKNIGYHVVGYDLLSDAVDRLRKKSIECYVAATVAEFRDQCTVVRTTGYFDVVTCVDVNYYFENQEQELRGMLNIVKDEGIIIMRCRTMKWLVLLGSKISILMPGIGVWLVAKALRDYQFAMSANELIKVIERIGGQVVYSGPKGALPSKRSSVFVKAWFALSSLVWEIIKIDISIGFIIVFKRSDDFLVPVND